MSTVRYRPETQARALLRLVATVAPLEYGDLDMPGSDRHERRRAREAVQAIADRRPFGDPGATYRDRCRAALRDLRRIADVDRDAFAAECAAVDALESAAMHHALVYTQPLQGPRRPPPTMTHDDMSTALSSYEFATQPEADTAPIDNIRRITDYRADAQDKTA